MSKLWLVCLVTATLAIATISPGVVVAVPTPPPCSNYKSTAERSLPYEICTKNSAIGRIQKALGLPKTGKFDAKTFDKIVSFQASRSLQQTGKIDLATLDEIADFVDNGYGSTACKFNITRANLPWKKCDYSPSIATFQSFLGLKADGYFRAHLAPQSGDFEAGFAIALVLNGSGSVTFANAPAMEITQGDALVIPHIAGNYSISGANVIVCRPPLAELARVAI